MAGHPIKLIRETLGPWSVNAYALICPATRHSVLVDPGADPGKLIQMLSGTMPRAVLITHSHPDHIGALEAVQKQLDVPVMAHPALGAGQSPVAANHWLRQDEEIDVGEHLLRVDHTPGHTDDQICLIVSGSPVVIVGDTIFEGGPGKTWSGADFQQTLATLKDRVLAWPDESICYPGHGSSFRLGDQRAVIEAFLSKDHGNFFGDATWEM